MIGTLRALALPRVSEHAADQFSSRFPQIEDSPAWPLDRVNSKPASLSKNNNERVAGIVESVFERDPSERAEFFEKACRDDVELRKEIESLLRFRRQRRISSRSPPTKLRPKQLSIRAES